MNSLPASRPRRQTLIVALLAAIASLVFAGSASASPPVPPFKQCPAVGFDTGCEILIVVNAQGGFETYTDPSQPAFDGSHDVLVGVQNNSGTTVTSIPLKGGPRQDIFGFDGNGLCSGVNETGEGGFAAPPEGCPFGPTGYEGPDTSFTYNEENFDEGSVNFLAGTLKPGDGAYLSMEEHFELQCASTHCEASTLATTLSGGAQSGATIAVPEGTPVTDDATLSGPNAGAAGGIVNYRIYTDSKCQDLLNGAGEVTVTDGSVPSSEAETLPRGTYYWQAVYSGDSHNGASTSPCGSEVEHVHAPFGNLPELGRCVKGKRHTGEYEGKNCVHVATAAHANAKWQPGPGAKKAFTAAATNVVLETAGGKSITCASASLPGEYTGAKTASAKLTLNGCTYRPSNQKCQSSLTAEGTIEVGTLVGELGYITTYGTPQVPIVGWDLKLPASTFTCGKAPETITTGTLEGSVIGPLTPVNKMTKTMTLAYAQSSGHQLPEFFEGAPKDTLSLKLRTLTEETIEQAGLSMQASIKNGELLEVKAQTCATYGSCAP